MSIEFTMEKLRQLRLPGMLTGLEQQLSQPVYGDLSFEQRFGQLVDAEASQRDSARLKRILKSAQLKINAEPEQVDYRSSRGLDRSLFADLLSCEWIQRRQNLLITGHTGTGKTWLACSLGVQAARNGMTVGYRRVRPLLQDLELARADGTVKKVRAQLARLQLLILDDFGLSTLDAQGRADLLEVLDDRINVGSTIVAGQMPFKEWHGFINDPALADAILDRLIHSSHKLTLKGESMRKVKSASDSAPANK